MDDEFGGFEAAPSSSSQVSQKKIESDSRNKLPEWILDQTKSVSLNSEDNNTIESLQDELSRTKEHLLDQQMSYIQLQAEHRQELDSPKALKQLQTFMNQALQAQHEALSKEFRQRQHDLELTLIEKVREINKKFEKNLSEKFECKLAEFQETLIKHYESEFEDLELKIKFLIEKQLKEMNIEEKKQFKNEFVSLEHQLKQNNDKQMQKFFQSQADMFRDQAKSTILQEHLIHKDLINSKLEKLFRDSEEKRRKTNILFAKHLNGLNFFIENAAKQMGILREAQKDMLKNKEIVDFFGDAGPSGSSAISNSNYSLSNFANFVDPTLKSSFEQSQSKGNSFEFEDDPNLIDEELLS
ncbi:hypothetical protein BpHYR1_031887 [Brachionus plicatilis]|uniref:Uncharacterized protein n=1 Tax=Brachionus plicatilis TaxID=10195 RepID=A0A3M7SU41_BRAPC|nr:hypothetical protein BpHYR1_031887 [Brachionus plicatilis]